MGPLSATFSPSIAHPTPSGAPAAHRGIRFHDFLERLSLSSVVPTRTPVRCSSRGTIPSGVHRSARDEEPTQRDGGERALPSMSTVALGGVTVPILASAPSVETHVVRTAMSMEQLLPDLVRRIAWGGDARRATVRLELGRGALDGTQITIHAEGGRVTVELAGGSSAALDAFRERVDQRLRGRGIVLDEIRVV